MILILVQFILLVWLAFFDEGLKFLLVALLSVFSVYSVLDIKMKVKIKSPFIKRNVPRWELILLSCSALGLHWMNTKNIEYELDKNYLYVFGLICCLLLARRRNAR